MGAVHQTADICTPSDSQAHSLPHQGNRDCYEAIEHLVLGNVIGIQEVFFLRGVYAPATFCHETVYLCSGFAVTIFSAQTGLCETGTVFGTYVRRGVYARAPLFYETVYLCSGILTTTRDLPRLSLEVVVVSGQRLPTRAFA